MVLLLGTGRLSRRLATTLARRSDVTWVRPNDVAGEDEWPERVTVLSVDPSEPPTIVELVETTGAQAVLLLSCKVVAGEDPKEELRALWPEIPVITVAEGDAEADHETVRVADLLHDGLLSRLDRLEHQDSARAVAVALKRLPKDAEVAIFCHDNPDPDALASAMALRQLIEQDGRSATIWYGGRIEHQSNVAMVRLLKANVRRLSRPDEVEGVLRRANGFIMVDMHRVGSNNMLPQGAIPLIVIDHHPPTGLLPPADVLVLRSEFGATSSLVAHLLMDLTTDPTTEVATGLVYGIRSDTLYFTRGFSTADLRALSWLDTYADPELLRLIENPPRSPETLEMFAEALGEMHQEAWLLLCGVRGLPNRDALPQIADFLLETEGVDAVIVFGPRDGRVHLSARSRRDGLHLGWRLSALFPPGMAGGHRTVAGGQVTYAELLGHDEVDVEGQGVVRAVIAAMSERLARLLEDEDLPDGSLSGGNGA